MEEEELEQVCENCIHSIYQSYFDSCICTDTGRNIFAPEVEGCDEFEPIRL